MNQWSSAGSHRNGRLLPPIPATGPVYAPPSSSLGPIYHNMVKAPVTSAMTLPSFINYYDPYKFVDESSGYSSMPAVTQPPPPPPLPATSPTPSVVLPGEASKFLNDEWLLACGPCTAVFLF